MFNYFGNHISFVFFPFTVPLQHPSRATLGIPVQDGPINHELLRAVVRAMVHLRFNLQAHLNELCRGDRKRTRAHASRRGITVVARPREWLPFTQLDRSETAMLISFERRPLTGPRLTPPRAPQFWLGSALGLGGG